VLPRPRPETSSGGLNNLPSRCRRGDDESNLGASSEAPEETEAELLDQAEAGRHKPVPVVDVPGLMFAACNLLGLVKAVPGRIAPVVTEPSPGDATFLAARFAAGDDALAAVQALRRHRADALVLQRAAHEADIAAVTELLGQSPSPAERRIIEIRLEDKDTLDVIVAAIMAKREREAQGKRRKGGTS
jgi:hypothetical protein